jgi:hypothetical protein
VFLKDCREFDGRTWNRFRGSQIKNTIHYACAPNYINFINRNINRNEEKYFSYKKLRKVLITNFQAPRILYFSRLNKKYLNKDFKFN